MPKKYVSDFHGAFKMLCMKHETSQKQVGYAIGLSRESVAMRLKKQQFNPYYIATLLADELDYDLIIRTRDGDEIIIKEPLPEGLEEKIEEYKATHKKPETKSNNSPKVIVMHPLPTEID